MNKTIILKNYIYIDAGPIHYRSIGDLTISRPLVFLHQTASASVMFEALMDGLKDDFNSFAPDTPGYGASFDPIFAPSIKDLASYLFQSLQTLQIESINLLGHHTGAALALQFALDYPQSVHKLILSGPPLLSAAQKQTLSASLNKPATLDITHLTATWERIQSRLTKPNPDLALREYLLTLRAKRYGETYQAVFEQDVEAQLAQIDCPCLVIVGENDTIYESAYLSHQKIKNSRYREIAGAGTYIFDENTSELIPIIKEFLLKV